MAVALKLYRVGKRGYPCYKIVAVNKRHKSNGRYIESVGTYDPHKKDNEVILKKDRYDYWKSVGAIISEGVKKLAKSKGI